METTNQPFGDILLQRSFTSAEKIKSKDFGKQLASKIYSTQANQKSLSFYGGRIARWRENRLWSKGSQNMAEFIDLTGIGGEGKKAYVNVDMKEQMKGAELFETLVTYLSSNEEYPCIEAIDDDSRLQKKQAKEDAIFRMENVGTITQLQELTGVQIEPHNAYVPNSELEADLKFELDFQIETEVYFEERLIELILGNNPQQKKRRIYRDLGAVNCSATKVEIINGKITYRVAIPENLIYNFFYSDNGEYELGYIGEIYSLKVIDIRQRYGASKTNPNGLSEKEIFNLAKSATTTFNPTNKFTWSWQEQYNYSYDRPYDDYSIDIFDFEVKVPDVSYYTEKQDNFGKKNITLKQGKPDPQNENTVAGQVNKEVWYRGVYCTQSQEILYWGLPDVVIKPYMNIAEAVSSWSIVIPNNDGEYVPSIFERAIEPLREYVLCKLKRKQLLATLSPAGFEVDIDGITDLDIGQGNVIPYEEVIKIARQSGIRLYSSRGVNPMEKKVSPFRDITNAAEFQQIIGLTNNLNALDQEVRGLLGVSIYLEGQQLPGRTPNSLVENQNQSATNVFGYLQYAYNSLIEQTYKKMCMLIWDDEVIKKGKREYMNKIFDIHIKMKPTQYEKQLLEQSIQTALDKGLIKFSDAIRVREIKSAKLAAAYLATMEDKAVQEQLASSQQMQQENAKLNQEAGMAAQAQKDEAEFKKLEAESKIKELEAKNKSEQILLQGILDIYKTTGGILPKELQQIGQLVLTKVGTELGYEMQQEQAEIEAVAQEQDQLMQQQMEEKGVSPEEMQQMMQQGQEQEMGEEQMQEEVVDEDMQPVMA